MSEPYPFDHAATLELERLHAVESAYDPATMPLLEELGVGEGWRCLEVGAGAGSVACWLAERVGPAGLVVATDLETSYLDGLVRPNLKVVRHDVIAEPAPEGPFDLVHARLVVEWLPRWEEALRHMVDALRPGGLLVLEDIDWRDRLQDEAAPQVFEAVVRAVVDLFEASGVDVACGRRLHGRLRRLGLHDVASRSWSVLGGGGPNPVGDSMRLGLERLADRLLESGLLDEETLATALAATRDPSTVFWFIPIYAAWGRKG